MAFTYDQLNRIATAETPRSSLWANQYTVDPWGNLTKSLTYNGKPEAQHLDQTADLKNRFVGFCHDAAGNLLNQGACGTSQYTYDAENRISTTAGATYVYDGDGVRVKKSSGAAPATLYWGESFTAGPIVETDLTGAIKAEYVYFGGKRIARRDYPCASAPDQCVHYYFSDHLNSANVVTNASGVIEEESDFYPFGGERVVVAGTGNHFKFTGKERDQESGLDYFGARYYANSLGRFLTPDWADKPTSVPYAKFEDPQSLNLYSYLRNHPTAKIDADGHEGFLDSIEQYLAKLAQPFTDSIFGDSGRGNSGGPADNYINYRAFQQNTKDLAEGVEFAQTLFAPLDLTGTGAASKAIMQHDPIGVAKAMAPLLIPLPGGNAGRSVRSFESFQAFKNEFGKAGENQAWHHIVEQCKAGEFGAKRINSTDNIVKVEGAINQKLANYYSSKRDFTGGLTVRDWLKGKSWQEQYKFGVGRLNEALRGKL